MDFVAYETMKNGRPLRYTKVKLTAETPGKAIDMIRQLRPKWAVGRTIILTVYEDMDRHPWTYPNMT